MPAGVLVGAGREDGHHVLDGSWMDEHDSSCLALALALWQLAPPSKANQNR
jgi:hypothetical protein